MQDPSPSAPGPPHLLLLQPNPLGPHVLPGDAVLERLDPPAPLDDPLALARIAGLVVPREGPHPRALAHDDAAGVARVRTVESRAVQQEGAAGSPREGGVRDVAGEVVVDSKEGCL